MVLAGPGVAHVEITLHIGPLAKVEIQVGVGIAVAVLAVDIGYAPTRVLKLASRIVRG
jgi:hypothetical protein